MLQGREGQRNGAAAAMGIDFEYVHPDLGFEEQVFKDVGVRYKGNGTFIESRASLKRSLKVDLNHYVKGQKLGDVTMLTLQNNVADPSGMNEVLAYQLYRDAGVPAPRTAYARVFVTVPGQFDRQYLGLYSLSETVDKHFIRCRFGTRKGAIFKPVTPSLFADLGHDWSKYKQIYDPKTELFDEQKEAVMKLCRLVTHADDAEFAARIGEHIDLPEFARFMAVMVWLSDLDGLLGPGQNFYLYLHPRSGLFEFIPWDLDRAFGQYYPRGTQEQRENLRIHQPWLDQNRFLERMFKVDAFKRLYLECLDEFSRTCFQPERFARQVDELAPVIRPAVREESSSLLAQFDRAVAGESVSASMGGFGGPQLKPIKGFAVARTRSVIDQLAGRSAGQALDGFGLAGPPAGASPFGGPGGPDAFGPGQMFAPAFLTALDDNHDGAVTHDEFQQGFARWFETWNQDASGQLTEAQLRAGINRDLSPFPKGFPAFPTPPGAPTPQGTPPGAPQAPGPAAPFPM